MTNIKRVLRPDKLVFALFGLLVGLSVNILSDFLTENNHVISMIILAGTAAVAFVVLLLKARAQRLRVVINRFIALRTQEEREQQARRGLIVFVSLYNELKRKPEERLSPELALEAAKQLDYRKMAFEESNLQPAIDAITGHISRLEHCWLISTTAANKAAAVSLPFAPVLSRYLLEQKGVRCAFHGDKDARYAVPLDDDGEVTVKTRDLVQRIFVEAAALGLSDNDIVADFTGCPRSMILGMILACLDRGRDIQFQGTHYNELAKPQGLYPLLFDFEVEVSPD